MNVKRISLLVLLCLVSFGCDESKLFSTWREREISIDGKYADWGAAMAYYDERTKVILNLVNDADYLYVCLITRNRAIESKIIESGLTIWFDPDDGQKKAFGIRFPMGGGSIEEEKRDITKDWRDQEDMSGVIDREKERLKDKNFNKRLETLEGLQDKLEIIRGGDKRDFKKDKPPEFSLEEAKKFGIEAKVGRENDYFVYELKVPLMKSSEHIYAIEAKKGQPIGLGLEAGGQMPMKRGSMFGSPDELNLWFSVVLSTKGN